MDEWMGPFSISRAGELALTDMQMVMGPPTKARDNWPIQHQQ